MMHKCLAERPPMVAVNQPMDVSTLRALQTLEAQQVCVHREGHRALLFHFRGALGRE